MGSAWHCYDVERDPYEAKSLDSPSCHVLEQLAMTTFGRLPGGEQRK